MFLTNLTSNSGIWIKLYFYKNGINKNSSYFKKHITMKYSIRNILKTIDYFIFQRSTAGFLWRVKILVRPPYYYEIRMGSEE